MKKHCTYCGAFVNTEDMLMLEGDCYCRECVAKCDDCGDIHFTDEMYTPAGADVLICENCVSENYTWCHDCEELYPNENVVYVESFGDYVCEDCFNANYGGCANCGYTTLIGNLCYSEIDDCFYCEACYEGMEDDDNPTYSYHSGLGRDDLSKNYRYRIGVELEREDRNFLNTLDKKKYLGDYGWVIEYDGSLSQDGFEAISPILPLRIGDLIKDFFKNEDIKKLTRAKFSSRCGGHITISDVKRTPDEIIDDIAGYLPILYALFPNRTPNDYCYVVDKEGYKTRHGHVALNRRSSSKGGGLEIRLFDAPKDEKDLLNRFRLCKYMLQHKATTIPQGLKRLNDSDRLRKIVKYHLDTYNIKYKDFYDNIVEYARKVDKVGVRISAKNIEKLSKKSN